MKRFLFLIPILSLTSCIQDDEFHSYTEHSLQKKNSIYAGEGNKLDTINEPPQEEKGDPPPKETSGNGNKP